jgi:tetratricopeptide (TPR) repeat protein
MKFDEKVKTLLKEADLYKSQGLLNEALDTYRKLQGLIEATRKVKNKERFLNKIAIKIDGLYRQMEKEFSAPPPPSVSDEARSVIKDMVSPDEPEAKGSVSMASALALAKFGQYEQAIEEFTQLLDYEELRVDAAKHIVWCWIQKGEVEKALGRVKQWKSGDLLSLEELNAVRDHFEKLVQASGLDKRVSTDRIQKDLEPESEVDDEDILDVDSTKFELPRGPRKDETVELEVSFQAGKYLKMLVPKKEQQLIDSLKVGDRLNPMTFFSPIAIFSGTGYISSKVTINAGPKKGDYSLEVKILSIQT